MARNSLNTRDSDKLIADLRQTTSPRQFAVVIEQLGREVGVIGESYFPQYPPPRPPRIYITAGGRQRVRKQYKRTGTLGRSLNSRTYKLGDRQVVAWGTNVKYGPRVIGDPKPLPGQIGQAWMHVGRWTPLRQAVLSPVARAHYRVHIAKRLRGAISTFKG